MRTCSVCGKGNRHGDLCEECFKGYVIGGIYPDWLSALCKIQHAFEVNLSSKEISFIDLTELEAQEINIKE